MKLSIKVSIQNSDQMVMRSNPRTAKEPLWAAQLCAWIGVEFNWRFGNHLSVILWKISVLGLWQISSSYFLFSFWSFLSLSVSLALTHSPVIYLWNRLPLHAMSLVFEPSAFIFGFLKPFSHWLVQRKCPQLCCHFTLNLWDFHILTVDEWIWGNKVFHKATEKVKQWHINELQC